MEPRRVSDLTLGISSAGQHRDGFTGAGQILEQLPGVLPLRRHGASHRLCVSGLCQLSRKKKMMLDN